MQLPDSINHFVAPAPDRIVAYSDGTFGPMMFHYATESCNIKDIAIEHGFALHFVSMFDSEPEESPAVQAYDDIGIGAAIDLWNPDAPEGWTIAGVCDTDNGPCAYFLRHLEDAGANGDAT